jgi:hypothetical protein
MNHNRSRGRRALHVATLSLILALAILAAAAPQTANAQTTATCRTFYVFREGDTKPRVAHTFDVPWREIADANDLNTTEKVAVGTRLCIPEGEDDGDQSTPAGSSNADILISIAGNTIRLSVDDFSNRHTYLVKARSADEGIGGWTKLGRIQVARNDAQSFSFSLPNDLRDAARLSVCLKDQTTDELICRNVVNP